ncbi:MAG: Uma2 family endonuclease [Anaerolineae bacterium]|nr:Uma2 family endonuclease [Anaerolineae bacterium]
MVETRTFTADDLLTLTTGQGERYELVEGELRVMAAAGGKHGWVADAISGEFYVYLKTHKTGIGVTAETGFFTRGDDRTVRAPDYAYIPKDRIPVDGLPDGYLAIVPALVVEVISPHDRAGEIEEKTQEWIAFGVDVVWVVYPTTERVYVYTQAERSPVIYTADDTITGGHILPEFSVAVSTFFEMV